MTVDLNPEQQRVIELAVRSDAYQNPSEVLDQALEMIREQLGMEGGCSRNGKERPRT